MPTVALRVERERERIRPKVAGELDLKPLSALLRRETWLDHERAQFSAFELSLADGTVPRDAYAELVANIYLVYEALETRVADLATDPLVGRFHIEELARVPHLEKDLAHFYGSEWRARTADDVLLPTTKEYAQRVADVSPIGFIAHHYTRYLADLSGGLMIYAALKKAWGTDDGLAYYDFSAIGDPVGFKNAYRDALNTLPLDAEQKLDLIGEVMVAYEYNIEMGKALARKHLGVEA